MELTKQTKVLFTCISAAFFLSLLFFFYFLLFFILAKDKANTNEKTSLYQYQEISSSDHSLLSMNGFLELNRKLSNQEFISYFNPISERSVIISNFASEQYKCTGSCSCSNSVRKSSTFFTRPLFLIFSALSTSMALKIASTTFHDHCLHQKSDFFCDEQNSNVESEVYSCSKKEGVHNEIEAESNSEYADYFCTGHCLPKRFHSPQTRQSQNVFFEEKGKCEDFKISRDIRVRRREGQAKQTKTLVSGKKKTYPSRYSELNRNAGIEFRRAVMTEYCKEISKGRARYTTSTRIVRFCVGGYNSVGEGRNIQCTLTSESKRKEAWELKKE